MMKVFGANITDVVLGFLNENLKTISNFEIANKKMYDTFGILHFFDNNDTLESLKLTISDIQFAVKKPDRAEYGDFQTNSALTNKATSLLSSKNISPEIVIEPTCGKGNFIIASLQNFKNLKRIFGIEIYKPYIWETKFNIINFFLENPQKHKPEISIHHFNVFDFDFKTIASQYPLENILIIGNPPWVTNSKLGSLNASNLPEKQISKTQWFRCHDRKR
ncbi:MAG: hypothetical protein HC892_16660 [Saprospiraceae bacterium]|nr:hypothetical protein [Saprospiraceae bacterium]